MKKILSFLALASIATLSMVGCNKDADKTQAGVPDNITNSKLTPDEHKANLEQTAIDFVNYIDPADTEDIIASLYALAQYMSNAYEDEYYSQMAWIWLWVLRTSRHTTSHSLLHVLRRR